MGTIALTEEERLEIEHRIAVLELEHGDLDEIIPAYAVTIHKSQGSEYPAVVIPLSTQHYLMLRRNLIYTGITRGKRLVVLVGSGRRTVDARKAGSEEVIHTIVDKLTARYPLTSRAWTCASWSGEMSGASGGRRA